jgi:hypothetical protein
VGCHSRCKQLQKRENFKIKIRHKQRGQDKENVITEAGSEGLFRSACGRSWRSQFSDDERTSATTDLENLVENKKSGVELRTLYKRFNVLFINSSALFSLFERQ